MTFVIPQSFPQTKYSDGKNAINHQWHMLAHSANVDTVTLLRVTIKAIAVKKVTLYTQEGTAHE